MGLIKAATSSVSSGLGDQFKEFVTCPEIEKDVIIQRGQVNHGVGNKKYTEGVISNGSTIAVPQGMAMMIIDNGAIKEFTSEAGTYTFDTSSEPSIFTGGLGNGIKDTIKLIGNRITYGGQAAKDQRVYYVNLLNITGNKFGSPNPKKITDEKYGMLEVTFYGEYAFKVVDPAILIQSVIGANPKDTVTYDDVVGSQLKGKFVEQLTQALSVVMRKHKVSFGDLGLYNSDISGEMNTILNDSWRKQYGLEITDVALTDINLTDKSMERINKIDDATIFSDTSMQSGLMANASAEAMKSAASNSNGAMMGFMGMNMANQTGSTMMGAINANGSQPQLKENELPEPGTIFSKKEEVINQVEETNNEAKPEENNSSETIAKISYCPNCGNKVGDTNFCTNCGYKLKNN
jgi:membrane protease subunit (stomatin/prohibitin family)